MNPIDRPTDRISSLRNARSAASRLAWRPLALAAASLFLQPAGQAAGPVPALPSGLQVVQGQASVQTSGARMTVTNSANALLNWQQFSIGAGQAVHFVQPAVTSKVLNRVVGSDPSSILGSLSSNGQVWLLNPNGVLFGAGARVDVAGLVASTLAIGNNDWQTGRLRLGGAADGAFGGVFDKGSDIVNQGELRSTSGGKLLLIASGQVRNEGLIAAPDGQVLLAAGSSIELVDSALPRLGYALSAPQGAVLNLGQIQAGSGRIDLQAALVNQQGLVRADGLATGPGGEVLITGSQGVQLAAASHTGASGGNGGRVRVDAGSASLLAAGTLDATGSAGTGGSVTLLGRQLGLLDGALVDASGSAGGGAVRLGGGLQGQDPAFRNAEASWMAPGARIQADATLQGDGGLVVLWSNRATRAYGSLSARGGPAGGNGGFIETSGGWIDARPHAVRTDAPAGRAGRWLIDPHDILITDETSDALISAGPDFTSNGDNSRLSTSSIVAALTANNHVSVTTSIGGEGNGDILVSGASIRPTPTGATSLTLNAIGSITVEGSSITSQGAPLSLQLNAGKLGGNVGQGDGSANGGAVRVASSTLSTRGGDIVIGGPSVPCGPVLGCTAAHAGAVASSASRLIDGIAIESSTLDAGAGRIVLSGHSLVGFTDTAGVAIRGESLLQAREIDLQGSVDAHGTGLQTGVLIDGSALNASQRLIVNGAAHTTTFSGASVPTGVMLQSGSQLQIGNADGSPTALLTINGLSQVATYTGNPPTQSELPVGDGSAPPSGIGVSLSDGSVRLKALGGAAIEVTGADRSPQPGIGLYVGGDSESVSIDASQGSKLTLQSGQVLLLSGGLKLPEGGLFTLDAGGLLLIEDASVTGGARDVLVRGELVSIGAGGGSTRLVFGDSTSVDVQTRQLRLGADASSLPTNEDVRLDPTAPGRLAMAAPLTLLPPRQALSVQRALQLDPPEVSALLATGGTLRIAAEEVVLGFDAALYSAASGTAISLGGLAPDTNLARFINQGGSGALSAPNGRWLVHAQDSHATDGSFQPGGLQPGFLQYGPFSGVATPAQGNNGFLFAATPQLTLLGTGTIAKVYDGSDSADLGAAGLTLGGLLGGHAPVGGLRFADKNAGTNKALLPEAGPGGYSVMTTDDTPVYGYALDTERLRGSITPRALMLSDVVVAPKTYDGSATATVTGWTLAGVLTGDEVRVQAGTGLFNDANVGSAKPVNASAGSLAGADAGNYSSAGLSRTTTAAISPATLAYVAHPVVVSLGQALPTLGGTVTGFVAGETLASATQGLLSFQASLADGAEPGVYAINGSGLSAANYRFVQAPGNLTAFTLRAPAPAGVDPQINPFITQAALGWVLPGAQATSAGSGRMLDALSAMLPEGGVEASFAGLDLDKLSASSLAAVLAARDAYKKTLFQQALAELERNPAAADAVGCATPQQAASGQCLTVASINTGLDISNARVVEGAPVTLPGAGAGVAPAAPAPAPALATGPAATPAPTPVAAPPAPGRGAPAPVALAALPADTTVNLPARRGVALATLPQIQRKIAVVIGIDQYRDSRIPRLSNAVNDARAVAAALETRLGYETLVLENASRATLFRTLNQLAGAVGPADSVVLYYAGHGERVEKSGQGYWQPADADASRPETWIANTDIDRVLRQLPASQVAMISDSCFSGGLVGGERIRGVSAAQDPAGLLGRRAAVVMTSGGNEPVFDSGQNGHSPFAWSLMQSMQQVGGWKPGSSVFEQVRFAVARKLPQRPQYGAARDAGHEAGADYLFEQRQLQAPVK